MSIATPTAVMMAVSLGTTLCSMKSQGQAASAAMAAQGEEAKLRARQMELQAEQSEMMAKNAILQAQQSELEIERIRLEADRIATHELATFNELSAINMAGFLGGDPYQSESLLALNRGNEEELDLGLSAIQLNAGVMEAKTRLEASRSYMNATNARRAQIEAFKGSESVLKAGYFNQLNTYRNLQVNIAEGLGKMAQTGIKFRKIQTPTSSSGGGSTSSGYTMTPAVSAQSFG